MKRKRSWVPYAVAAGKTAYNIYKRFKSGGSSSDSYRRTRLGFRGGGSPVTNQYDVRTQYTSKRMSKQRRRRIKRFKRLALKINTADMAQQTQVFLDSRVVAGALNSQGYTGFLTYGPNGTANLNDDARQVFLTNYGVAGTAAELMFKSCYMDIELVNTTVAGTTVVVDAYYVVCRKNVNNGNWGNLEQSFTTGFTEMNTITGGTTISAVTPGVAPFDAPNFCEKFKIYKKQRLVLSGGQVASFVIKDNKPKKIESTDVTQNTLLRGQKGILFVFSSVVDATGNIPISQLSFSVNRSYHYIYNVTSIEQGAQH